MKKTFLTKNEVLFFFIFKRKNRILLQPQKDDMGEKSPYTQVQWSYNYEKQWNLETIGKIRVKRKRTHKTTWHDHEAVFS